VVEGQLSMLACQVIGIGGARQPTHRRLGGKKNSQKTASSFQALCLRFAKAGLSALGALNLVGSACLLVKPVLPPPLSDFSRLRQVSVGA